MMISLLFVSPVYGQVDENRTEIMTTETKELVHKFEDALQYVTETSTKYTTEEVNIRSLPSVDSTVLDQSMINTEFEVVVEIDGWAMITTEDGYAYMKADWFSDAPVQETSYTEEDVEVLTRVLTGEAQHCSDQEQRLVGSVVLNRVNHPEFPDTIKDVVFQKGQYSCVRDGNYYREPTEANRANAVWLLENGSILPDNVVYQSGGKQGSGVHLKTDVHYYCYK